jgi:glycosyltransferase involved in cell wall biosynthesis
MKYDATITASLFNRPQYIEEFLDYFGRQSHPAERFEIIFVDDSGPEGYAANEEVIKKVRPKYKFPVRYFTTGLPKEVYGNTVARNLALGKAESGLIICIDDDCLPHFNFVEEHVKAHRGADRLMVSGVRVADRNKLLQPLPVEIDDEKSLRYIDKYRRGDIGAGAFLGSNLSVRRAHLEEAGGWNENLARPHEHGYTDRELGMRLMGIGLKFVLSATAVIYNRPTEKEVAEFRLRHQSAEKAHDRFKRIQRAYKAKRVVAAMLRCVPFAGKKAAIEFLKPKRVYT